MKIQKDRPKTKIAKQAVAIVVLVFVVLLVLAIIYYLPVIDRLLLRPCYHYPRAFIDC